MGADQAMAVEVGMEGETGMETKVIAVGIHSLKGCSSYHLLVFFSGGLFLPS